MNSRPTFLMTDPRCFDVRYRINPWMNPERWDRAQNARARAASAALRGALEGCGARIETIEGVPGLPDLVFPANAAVVLDGRALLARFRHPERRAEEPVFHAALLGLKARGLLAEVVEPPAGLVQEGAGDAIWDAARKIFWAGHGPRSSRRAAAVLADVFGQEVVPLALASDRFYHLDTCFCPLDGGQVLYYPPAFTARALSAIRALVPASQRVEASAAEAAAFCVNAVSLGPEVVMARAPESLRRRLRARGFRPIEVDLDPFILSGGAAYCLTLRLDRTSRPAASALAAE